LGLRGGQPAARGFYGRECGRPRRIVSCVPLEHCLAAAFSTNRRKPDDTQGDQQPANQRWLGNGPYSFAPRSRTLQNGLTDSDFAGKPVIAIVNTWSDMNTCHGHLRDVAQVVKRGVWETGGYPVELPAMSLGEIMMKPAAMPYRNLLSMETEELLRSNPIDGAVLLGGCDKTTPALITGAISTDLPFIYVPAGTYPPVSCCTVCGGASVSAALSTAGSTGLSCDRARSPTAIGRKSKPAASALVHRQRLAGIKAT
jgi:Dehydratase family